MTTTLMSYRRVATAEGSASESKADASAAGRRNETRPAGKIVRNFNPLLNGNACAHTRPGLDIDGGLPLLAEWI